MFLKALTLKGFKSFADATTMQLEPGVSVVVGPNGSGKSNVVDAIAWVLGAQAPSSVRSQKMDDVIFPAGTAKRPALGRAEVILTIDNSNQLLPIDFSEVSISRTLFRTGESEYAINGVGCRLLDIQELLSDAGVGRQQHVIVSQGQIDAVLNARPEDRRSIIEEAAGVLKFRRRKEKAERRLDATEANLLRVQDLLREVRRQLRPLERQADAARRHGDLINELMALRVFLAGREFAGLRTRMTALAGERLEAEAADKALRSELARLDTLVLAAEAEMTARGDADVSDALMRVEQLRERARGLANVIAERRRSMERDRGQLMDAGVVANLEADGARVREELDEVVAGLAQLEPDSVRLEADEALFASERETTQLRLSAAAASPVSAASAAAEVRGELRSLRSALERDEAEQRRLNNRLEALRQRGERLVSEVERLKSECEEAEAAESPLVAEVETAETRRLQAEAAADAAVAARQESAAEMSRWQARAEALAMALDSARARAGAERLVGLDGVLGTLLDLVEVDDGWEAAFEAAAGEAMLAVVVDDPVAARRALSHLRQGDATGAVLALHSGGAVLALSPVGVGELVRRHVRARNPRLDPLLDALLASAVRVDTWEEAVDIAGSRPSAIVVTPDGHRFSSSGWRLGAAGGGATAAALEDAQLRAEAARAVLAECEATVAHTRTELASARQSEGEVVRRLDTNDATFTAASEALARAQGERRESATEIENLDRAQQEVNDRGERECQRIAELDALLPELEADEEAEVAAARLRGETRAQLEARAAVLSSRRQDLEVRNAGFLERQNYLERRLAEVERRLEADALARAEAAEHRNHVERDIGAITRLTTLVESRRQVIEGEHVRLMEVRRRQSDEVRALAQRLDESRRARGVSEKQLEEARERMRRIELEETEVKLRTETSVETMRRELDVEPDVAVAAAMPTVPEGTNHAARVRDLERELRLLGPINPLALEEFNALQERHVFLETQLEDVKSTRRELGRVIRAVDEEIQRVFTAAYADVADNFTKLFALLFPGGGGRLTLTNPDDMLNTGIEVEAKPSGKNVKKLSLLSGGERSLTALAYLFVVFRSRPSPFYVMDEVEAALDDVNLHRFLGLIHEFRNDAQLLIVSHQKRTMEAADCLLGVSMQPGGSSKVIVERVTASP